MRRSCIRVALVAILVVVTLTHAATAQTTNSADAELGAKIKEVQRAAIALAVSGLALSALDVWTETDVAWPTLFVYSGVVGYTVWEIQLKRQRERARRQVRRSGSSAEGRQGGVAPRLVGLDAGAGRSGTTEAMSASRDSVRVLGRCPQQAPLEINGGDRS